MAYHVSKLGSYGPKEHADMEGCVPEADDGPWYLKYDHGHEATHNEDGSLTEYGEWWEDEGWPEKRDAAVAATQEAEEDLTRWQESN